MKKLIFVLFANLFFAQQLQPTIGLHYTGGFTYGMDHELFSGQVGMLYEFPKVEKFKDQPAFLKSVEVSGTYYYDFYPKTKTEKYDFYNVKIQVAKQFSEWWNLVAYGGYVNNFENNIMKPYSGDFRTNLSYGIGIQTFDDHVVGEVLFEELAGYPHLSVGVTYKFRSLIKKKNNADNPTSIKKPFPRYARNQSK